MGMVTSLMLAIGVLLSAVSGVVCYVGEYSVASTLDWLPTSGLVIAHPQVALAVGALLVILGVFCQPQRT